MHLLLLAGFSNYSNRAVRRLETIAEYKDAAADYWEVLDSSGLNLADINFREGDGVSTTQVINRPIAEEFDHEPDYLIAFDDDNVIVSRWFIMEIVLNRALQHELILRRDLISDYYDKLKEADIFVERGLCADNDPLIVNDEGMNLNKIKKSETLLKDEVGSAWIVGYFTGENATTLSVTTSAPSDAVTVSKLASTLGMSAADIDALLDGQPVQCVKKWAFLFKNGLYAGYNQAVVLTSQAASYTDENAIYGGATPGMHIGETLTHLRDDAFGTGQIAEGKRKIRIALNDRASSVLAQFKSLSYGPQATSFSLTLDKFNLLANFSSPIQKNGKYYRIVSSVISEEGHLFSALMKPTGAILDALTAADIPNGFELNGDWSVEAVNATVKLAVVEDTSTSSTFNFGTSAAASLENRAYKMFCMPLDPILVHKPNTLVIVPHDQTELTKRITKVLATGENPAGGIVDIQLLPYCPIRNVFTFAHDVYDPEEIMAYLDIAKMTEGVDYDAVRSGTDVLAYIFYCRYDSFSFSINQRTPILINKKIDSNLRMARLCSPNYQGSFDFSPAKNGGVEGYNVNFTYKPYTPYIRVAPIFGWLYGQEFNDQRGLICGGNFSLSLSTNAWAQYELNNKNYQNIFNREIQSLDLQQGIQMRDQVIGAVTGTVQGGVSGAATGAMVGGGYGAIAGAVIGTAASAAGGVIDINTLARQQKDQRSLQIDKFNYQLGNIKAIPNTLTKIDAFDISSKVFPFLEIYECSEEEKALFQEKIRLQSYTLMRIEKLGNQMTDGAPIDIDALHYVKGQLIRTDESETLIESHIWDEIYIELSKGVYI